MDLYQKDTEDGSSLEVPYTKIIVNSFSDLLGRICITLF
jgi:hypothetical protein